jgi:hypothetical protein
MSQAPQIMEAAAIERLINQRTWGRIHQLEVKFVDQRLVVHGYTSSYYSKQLALQAVLEILNSIHVTAVDLNIYIHNGR